MPEETIVPAMNDASATTRPELSPAPADKRPIIFGVIFAVIFILICAGIGVGLYFWEGTPILRDIFIIFLGLGIFFVILLLIALVVITAYLVLKINDLFQLLDREIKPILTTLQNTAVRVQGTTTFLSDHAVQPVITTVSTVSAARAIFRALFQRK